MWLLPVWSDHVRGRIAREQRLSERCRHRWRDERQYLTLCHLLAHPGRDPWRSGGDEGMRASTRRTFLQAAGATTAVALSIGFEWIGTTRRALAKPMLAAGTVFAPNAFVRIGTDNSVTVIAKHVEMGQGSFTGIATVLAGETRGDWLLVRGGR